MLFLIKILPKLPATTNFVGLSNIAVVACSRLLREPKPKPVTNMSLGFKIVGKLELEL